MKGGKCPMYNLNEFLRRPNKLSDLLPWAAFVASGVILNKDGSFQKTYRFRGPDLDSSTRPGLINIAARVNNVFKRLGTGWVIFVEGQRIQSQRYPESDFPGEVATMIDEERKRFFNSGQHFENHYYLTLPFLPPPENYGKWEKYLISRDYEKEETTFQTHLKNYLTENERVFSLFKEVMTEAEPLSDEETLTYLHSTVSTKRHPVKVPECPMYLDAYISDSPLITGLEPKLGLRSHLKYLRVISIKQFPGTSLPGILDNLNRLNFEYRWTCRFLCLDKEDAIKELDAYQKKHFSKRKSFLTTIREQITKKEAPIDNPDALVKSNDAETAIQELKADMVSYGFFTMAIVVMDADPNRVDKKAQAIEKTINSLGFVTVDEQVNAVDAWLGTIPGLFRANIRRPLIHTINLAHIFPISAIWAGPEKNFHLNGPVLMHTQTPDKTPFRLSLHIGDLGHTMIVGPTSMGKSVLLASIAVQYLRYPKAQVYIFDKDGSCRALTAGIHGDFYDLADEHDGALSFQPLAKIDNENERAWAAEWLYDYLRGENIAITPEIKTTVWAALCSLANAPVEERTISGFVFLVQDKKIKQAMQPLTLNGAFGKLFDASKDNLQYGRWQVFEMAKLMNMASAIPPTLGYLFHRLEQRFTGEPSVLLLDESSIYLENPIFAPKIGQWLKVLRKMNVSVILATQSPSNITDSPVASSIIESCLTKIYLPNPAALDQTTKPFYDAFGLNETEIRLIAQATPKRQYYYKSPLGSRLFELAMGPVALAYCGASSPQDQRMVQKILAEDGKENFNAEWLTFKNLPDALPRLKEFTRNGNVV
jgi:type IV secretion/conjugal transfer VirB4 family ATPase